MTATLALVCAVLCIVKLHSLLASRSAVQLRVAFLVALLLCIARYTPYSKISEFVEGNFAFSVGWRQFFRRIPVF